MSFRVEWDEAREIATLWMEMAGGVNKINPAFGEAFADAIFGLKLNQWWGPVRSSFGEHLVRVHQYEEARVPKLGEVANQVLGLWREQERDKALANRLSRLRGEYKIVDESDAR